MVITAQDLRAAGVEIPLFVGGAALTRQFTATRIASEYGGATLYAKDAMDGFDLANRLFGATTREALGRRRRRAAGGAARRRRGAGLRPGAVGRVPTGRGVSHVGPPCPPDLDSTYCATCRSTHVYPYLNLQMLLGRHGSEGSVARLLEQGDLKAWRSTPWWSSSRGRPPPRGSSAPADFIVLRGPLPRRPGALTRAAREVARFGFPRQRAANVLPRRLRA